METTFLNKDKHFVGVYYRQKVRSQEAGEPVTKIQARCSGARLAAQSY